MDLRSIINPDASSAVSTAVKPFSISSPTERAERRPLESSAVLNQPGYQRRPAPPPLKTPSATEYRSPGASSSHPSAQSPYPYNSPSSAVSVVQYPFPSQPAGYSPSIGHHSAIAPQATHSPRLLSHHASQSPYALQSAQGYSSALTSPVASQSYGHAYTQRLSHTTPPPLSAGSRMAHIYHDSPVSSPYASSQPYPPQRSQPGTPLGPPMPYPPPAVPSRHNSSDASQRHQSASSYSNPIRGTSVPLVQSMPQNDGLETEYVAQGSRERSISVSPKTKVPPQTKEDGLTNKKSSGQVTPSKRKLGEELEQRNNSAPSIAQSEDSNVKTIHLTNQTPTSAVESSRPFFDPIAEDRGKRRAASPPVAPPLVTNLQPPPGPSKESSPTSLRPQDISVSPSHTGSHEQPITPNSMSTRPSPTDQPSPGYPPSHAESSAVQPVPERGLANQTIPAKRELSVGSSAGAKPGAASQPPARKRFRRNEPPIWARKATKGSANSAMIPNRRLAGDRGASTVAAPIKPEITEAKPNALPAIDTSDPSRELNGVSLPQAQPVLLDAGPLGPWEPSITNVIPYEEITRVVMDFLFLEVVERGDVDAGVAGVHSRQGAQLEIEAKLGHLIDRNTNERLRLPLLTECVFNKDDPSWRVAFRSSMTESQHRTLNQFLNKTIIASKQQTSPSQAQAPSSGDDAPTPKPRIPLEYVHTRERDQFYELPPSYLPPVPLSIRPLVANKHKHRVRVTHDQKTGDELARIVKIRLADLDVYSPRTAFDWRLSVNLEMAYDGDVSSLVEVVEAGKRSGRSKDRMTYKHLAYQIDLTQVTMQPDATGKMEREHELEVEVSAARIREQGLLAKAGQLTQYEDLVKGFLDNVRTLARVVAPADWR